MIDVVFLVGRVLLAPAWLIGRLYLAILESEVWPGSWERKFERVFTERASTWGLWKRVVMSLLFMAGGLSLWMIVGLGLTAAWYLDKISWSGMLLIGIITAYLMVGGAMAAFVTLCAPGRAGTSKEKRPASPGVKEHA